MSDSGAMSEFTDYLSEVFERLGPVDVRSMFGGYGVFYEGLMFALVAEDDVYLKADAQNAGDFESRNLPAFEYGRKGKSVKMTYYRAPDEILDDRDAAADWARRSYAAAQRMAKRRPPRRK